MDTTDPKIIFDKDGVCNHCHQYDLRVQHELYSDSNLRLKRLDEIIAKIKQEGQGKDYDCILGVSGGVDSSYLAYIAKERGLRPLAVHFDNGWDSELAVDNIQKILNKLGIDLYTYVVDWDEFCDLQKSFLKASVPNAEIPTDHAISAVLWNTANKRGIRYILNGSNLRTEGIMPLAWTYSSYDYYHIWSIHRKFGTRQLQSFPKLGFFKFLYYVAVRKIRTINVLNYLEYEKKAAMQLLSEKFDWRPYQAKHYESVWTRFYQGYYLVKKFGYDKRRPHLSALINSGQLLRSDALVQMEVESYPSDLVRKDYDFTLKKFGFSDAEFNAILHEPAKDHLEYPNLSWLYLQSSKLQDAFVKTAKVK
jgi:N-acetyl sugar amidotransferase